MNKPVWCAKILFTCTLILLVFTNCGGGVGDVTTGDESSSGTAMTLYWPEGYSYNQADGEITVPSSRFNATVPAYVTKITLTITGEGIDPPIVLNVPLDTLKVNFAVTPGIRTFTLLIETSIEGLTFTATQTIDLVPGAQINLNFNLQVNAPPVVESVGASDTTPQTGATITVSCNATDPDDNPLSYEWSDGDAGGLFSGSGPSVSYTATRGGLITIACTVSDEKGGVDTGSVTIDANSIPVISSVRVSDTAPFVGIPARVSCNATDPDDDDLSYAWSDNGAGGSFSGSGSSVSYTASKGGSIKITCTVSDGRGGLASGSVTISAILTPTVTADKTSPNIGDYVSLTCDAGDGFSFSWSDNGAGGTFLGDGWSVSYQVGSSGPITITCTITDNKGNSGSGTVALNGNSSGSVFAGDTGGIGRYDVIKFAVSSGDNLSITCTTGNGAYNMELLVFAADWTLDDCEPVVNNVDNNGVGGSETIPWATSQVFYWIAVGSMATSGDYSCTVTSGQPYFMSLDTDEYLTSGC